MPVRPVAPPARPPEETPWGPPSFRDDPKAQPVSPLYFRRTATQGNPFTAMRAQRGAQGNPFTAMREQAKAAKPPEDKSANFVARELAARGTLNAALAAPSASGGLVANALAAARAGVKSLAGVGANNARSLVGMDRVERPSFGERYDEERSGAVDSALRSIPRPTVSGITAAMQSVPALVPGGESPGEAYDRNQFAFEEEEGEMRREHPTAAMIGDVGGDVGAIALGRRGTGAGNAIRRLETRLTGRGAVQAAESLAGDVSKALTPMSRRVARGGLRSLESGVEAAVLDVLKDPNADPLDTAAIAAGSQLVGSGILTGAQGLVSGGLGKAGVNITVAAMTTWGFLQVLKSSTPGGQDRILESMESGYDKVALLLAAGAGSAAIGATRYGRGNTALTDQTRKFLDGVATTHRGTLLSLLTDYTEGDDEERAALERTLTALAEDPTYRGKTRSEQQIVSRLRTGAGVEKYDTGGSF
jgi:hypothetical protein